MLVVVLVVVVDVVVDDVVVVVVVVEVVVVEVVVVVGALVGRTQGPHRLMHRFELNLEQGLTGLRVVMTRGGGVVSRISGASVAALASSGACVGSGVVTAGFEPHGLRIALPHREIV